jgi:hypothetical protein
MSDLWNFTIKPALILSSTHSPKYLIWTIVNLTVLLFSVVLFVDILYAVDHGNERPVAVAEFLIYNFVTSLLWILEVALKTYENSKDKFHLSAATGWMIAEWVVSLYFVCDSVHLVIQWKLNKSDLSEDLSAAVIGIISYSYLTASTFQAYYTSLPKCEYEQIQPSTLTI